MKWLDGYRKRYGEARYEVEAKSELARKNVELLELEEKERKEVEAGRKFD